jgi:hypothetical protein
MTPPLTIGGKQNAADIVVVVETNLLHAPQP